MDTDVALNFDVPYGVDDTNSHTFILIAFATDRPTRLELRRWCNESFGSADDRRWVDMIDFGKLYLARSEDVTLFMLRWS